jgi:hypothetical protein
MVPRLTLRKVELRSVSIPLRRPVVSKVGLFYRWPLILNDLQTEEGIVGRSYIEPYLERTVRYLVPAIRNLAEARKGCSDRTTRRFSDGARRAKYDRARRSSPSQNRGPVPPVPDITEGRGEGECWLESLRSRLPPFSREQRSTSTSPSSQHTFSSTIALSSSSGSWPTPHRRQADVPLARRRPRR